MPLAAVAIEVSTDWHQSLLVLTNDTVMLRELKLSDAPSLLAMLTTEEVTRFISPPAITVEDSNASSAGRTSSARISAACSAWCRTACRPRSALFQVKALGPDFSTAEWGFALGSPFWGADLFVDGARLVLDFAFETIGIHRLQARSAVQNARGNGALRKLGAVREGVLRGSLWSILETDWWHIKTSPRHEACPTVH